MKTILTTLGTLSVCTAARWYLDRKSRKPAEYAGGHVHLTALWNENGAFEVKLPADLLMALSGAALGTVWTQRRRSPVGAGLVLGGGLSNLLERARHKRVYDYVRFPNVPKPLNRYVFNLADFSILAGAVALAVESRSAMKTASQWKSGRNQ